MTLISEPGAESRNLSSAGASSDLVNVGIRPTRDRTANVIDRDTLLRRLQLFQNVNALAIIKLSGQRRFDIAAVTFEQRCPQLGLKLFEVL